MNRRTLPPAGQDPHAGNDTANPPPRDPSLTLGARLYADNDAKIRLLFPANSENVTTAAPALNRPQVAAGITLIRVGACKQFVPFDVGGIIASGRTDFFFKLQENGQDKTDWMPLVHFEDGNDLFAQPLSPFAGPSTDFTAPTTNQFSIVGVNYDYRINFDTVLLSFGAAITFNAMLCAGASEIRW